MPIVEIESDFAARHRLRLFSFDLSASRPPSQAEVARFLEIVSDPANQPVLVHCRNGVDRTGYMLGLYRIEADGWSPERAAREAVRSVLAELPAELAHVAAVLREVFETEHA